MKRAVKRKAKPAGEGGTTLAERVVDAPRLSAPQGGESPRRRMAGGDWPALNGGAQAPDRRITEARTNDDRDRRRFAVPLDLIAADASAAGPHPRLHPDTHFAALLYETARAVAATKDEDKAMRLLRLMKSEAALLIALADIGGAWPVMRTTRALTELADVAVSSAIGFLLRDAAKRGRYKPRDVANPGKAVGLHRSRYGKDGCVRA